MALPSGQKPSISVQLIVDNIKDFVANVQGGLNTALGSVKQWSGQVQTAIGQAFNPQPVNQTNVALQNLNATLQINQTQYQTLTVNASNYQAALASITVSSQAVAQAENAILNVVGAVAGGYQGAAIAAIGMGQATVAAVNQALIGLGKMPLTIQQNNQALQLLQQNINLVGQGLPMIASGGNNAAGGLNNASAAANVAGGAFDFLGNRIKAVVSSLLIVNVIFQAVQGFKDLLKASEDLSQSQYELAVAVESANKMIGSQVGNLPKWQEAIQDLSKTLQVFSKEDITNAVTQAIRLTGALNLTQKQIEDLITVSATLAQTSGKDLVTVLDEVGKAVAGGRLQNLENYGVVIHQNEIATEAFSLGLGRNVQNLTDQELALVRLNLIMQKSADITNSTAGYQETLAGQIKTADANAKNASDNIANDLGALQLYFKNTWADFLVYVSGVADKLTWLKDYINSFNADHAKANTIGAAPTLESILGVEPSAINGEAQLGASKINADMANGDFAQFTKDLAQYKDLLGITNDQMTQLAYAAAKYANALKDVNNAQNEAFRMSEHDASGTAPQPGTGDKSNTTTLTPDQAKALDDAGKQADKLQQQWQKSYDKNWHDYFAAFDKSFKDEQKDRDKAYNDEQDALAKASLKQKQGQEDALRNYNRDEADLMYSQSEKMQEANDEYQKKIIDNKKKYYDALRLLDEQYYFDIFDAVANNDAIAVLAAERKYALDKDKLKDKYNNDNATAKENYDDNINRIKQETADRQRLLDERYQQQLEDLKIAEKREDDEIAANYIKKKNAITAEYDAERDQIKAKLDEQNAAAADIYQTGLDDLNSHLQDMFGKGGADDTARIASLKDWDAYYVKLLADLQQYYQDAKQLADANAAGVAPPSQQSCPPGMTWSVLYRACLPNEVTTSTFIPTTTPTTPTGLSFSTNNTQKLVISSDGTVSETLLNSIVKELSDSIQTMVVERGG